jgi:hypothetical protein
MMHACRKITPHPNPLPSFLTEGEREPDDMGRLAVPFFHLSLFTFHSSPFTLLWRYVPVGRPCCRLPGLEHGYGTGESNIGVRG